jgi:hypothetical protein
MNKKKAVFIMSTIGLLIATTYFARDDNVNILPVATETSNITRNLSSATWVSNAKTIDELMMESDIVVRARVSEAPVTRIVSHEIPVWDENNNISGSTISKMLFSDTIFEIIKTYDGEHQESIRIMQTGGFDPSVSKAIEEVIDDPLYKVGEEYILFLVDISGDAVQAPNSQLYRIVNPFGRYRIDGKIIFSYGQDVRPGVLTVRELEAQIKNAPNQKLPSLTPTYIPFESTASGTPFLTIQPTADSSPEETATSAP